MDATATRPSSGIDLFSDESLTDPYDGYRRLRDEGPAVYLEKHDIWVIPRFAGVRDALRDWEHFSSDRGVALNDAMNEANVGTVLASDPPDHTKLRRVLSDQMSPGAIKKLNDQIMARADELVAGLVAQGEFDAVQELAGVFPISVVADLVGLPDEGRENFLTWANAVFDGFGPENDRSSAAFPVIEEMWEYLGKVAVRERLTPGSMGMAVFEAADRGEIDAESCFPLMAAYVAAGMDTTINSIGTMFLLLAENPDQFEILKSDRSLIRSAGNEVLRIESPLQLFGRLTTAEQTVEGQVIPAGANVAVLFGSANRDERKWDDPDVFDVTRNPVDHMGFGHGIHRCAGSSLARLEIESVLTSVLNRVDKIELAGDPDRRLNNTIRGLRNLPVSVQSSANGS